MDSAAKLKRAQDRILAGRPYAHQLREVMGNLSEQVNRASFPLLTEAGRK
jgi:F-type H+-transporting ATPase subunit gamma